MIVTGKSSFEREPLEASSYPARCIQVIDLGTQSGGKYPAARKVRLGFEIPSEKRVYDENVGEEPVILGKTYTATIGPGSNLRNDLENWRGKPFTKEELERFDLSNILGATALIGVSAEPSAKDSSKIINKINTVAKPMKGHKIEDQHYESVDFNFDSGSPNWELYKFVPDFLRDWIEESPEYKAVQKNNPYHGQRNADNNNSEPAQTAKSETKKPEVEPEVADDDDELPF